MNILFNCGLKNKPCTTSYNRHAYETNREQKNETY